MNSGLANGQHLGVSLAYYANGQTSFHNVGFVDLQKTIPISEDKLFEIASLGKVFTAILFVKLFERRLCSADDLVSKYVPELSHLSVLTLTHLLTHTGGLPREPADFVSIAPKNSTRCHCACSRTTYWKPWAHFLIPILDTSFWV